MPSNLNSNSFFLIFILCLAFATSCKPTRVNSPSQTSTQTVDKSAEKRIATPIPLKYAYLPSKERKFDLIHTRMEVQFDWEKEEMKGLATLTLTPYFYSQQNLELDAQAMTINSVRLLKKKSLISLKFQNTGKKLLVALDTIYSKGQEIQLEIDYVAQPKNVTAGGNYAITDNKGLYFINAQGKVPNKPRQIWTQGEPESSSVWFPTIDAPNERCTQEMHITVDSNYTTLSNGVLSYSTEPEPGKRTDVWEMKLPHAPYLFMMAIGEFAVVKDKWRDIELTYLVEKEYEPYAKAIFKHTPEMLEFFSNKLNYKYPWPKYAQVVVRDYVSGAMENTSASLFGEDIQSTDRELLDQNWDDIIAHEMFHQWFGDLVTLESWPNLPLNESFANYSEYLWNEYKHGKDESDYIGHKEKEQYFDESNHKQEPLIRYHVRSAEDMFDSHSYAKGGRILHMLRKTIGDQAFFEGLSFYLRTNQYRSVEVHNLRMAFEEVTGKDLNWFFDQWFLHPGHPVLRVSQAYQADSAQVVIAVEQVQDTAHAPVYQIPFQVETSLRGNLFKYEFTLQGAKGQFKIPSLTKPDHIVFDPEHTLLAAIDDSASGMELFSKFSLSNSGLTRYLALKDLVVEDKNPDTKLAELAVQKGLNDSFWLVREVSIAYLMARQISIGDAAKKQIEAIAENDAKTQVQAAAIALLAKENAPKHEGLFRRMLNHRSYTVAGSALEAFTSTDAEDKLEVMKRFEKETHTGIASALANVYSRIKDTTYIGWFTWQLENGKKSGQFNLITAFGQYAYGMKDSQAQDKCVRKLQYLVTKETSFIARFAAFRVLGLFSDRPDIQQFRKLAAEAEQNQTYRQYLMSQL